MGPAAYIKYPHPFICRVLSETSLTKISLTKYEKLLRNGVFREKIVQFLLHLAKISNILPKFSLFSCPFPRKCLQEGKLELFSLTKLCVWNNAAHVFCNTLSILHSGFLFCIISCYPNKFVDEKTITLFTIYTFLHPIPSLESIRSGQCRPF